MVVKSILIDTNTYIEFKKGNFETLKVFQKVKNIFICPIVTGELISGFIIGNREEHCRNEFLQFLSSKRIKTMVLDDSISEEFAQIYKELRQKGKPIPTNDIWIASFSRKYKIPLFSYDKHFKFIDNIQLITKPEDLDYFEKL
ncbi:MAG: type II toxin-antitoxin system VapC family toxin [Bacteroidales bacterium]|nr:type II toxin-antitoxin system VapC family toxin [Bacteroidales bacterium]